MASAFNIELSMSESPAEAQARAADALTEPASAIGLRLTERGAGELKYRPLVQWPVSHRALAQPQQGEDGRQVRAGRRRRNARDDQRRRASR